MKVAHIVRKEGGTARSWSGPDSGFLGYPRKLRVAGTFAAWYSVIDFTIQTDKQRPFWLRGDGAAISYSDEENVWIFTCGADVKRCLLGGPSPVGPWWEGGVHVKAVEESVSITSRLAFPAPSLPFNFYETGGAGSVDIANGVTYPSLLTHPGLILLRTSEGERIPALHIKPTPPQPAQGAFSRWYGKQPTTKYTILYSHGNAEDLGLLLDDLQDMANCTGANVLAYEYVGYSLSRLEGAAPSEGACYRSIEAAWDFLAVQLDLSPENIVLVGKSIGSGPSVHLASNLSRASANPRCCCGALVLQSALASGARVLLGGDSLSASLLQAFDIFINCEKISLINCPVGIIHGTADKVVPVSHGKLLFSLLKNPQPPHWLDGYGHNDIPSHVCFKYICGFLQNIS